MKIGDSVRVSNAYKIANENIKHGDIGKIVSYKETERQGQEITIVGVEFDRNINGHTCNGVGKKGCCAWITKKRLVPIGNNSKSYRGR